MSRKMFHSCLTTFSWLTLLGIFVFLNSGLAAASPYRFPDPETIPYEPLHFHLPQVEKMTLDNGIVLYVLENHDLPFIKINALVKTGSVHDPLNKEGSAELTAYGMRTGGTQKYTSVQIDHMLDFMATSIFFNVSKESVQVSLSTLSENIEQSTDILAQILMNPVFEQEKFELAKQLKEEELRRIKDNPQKLAFREFFRCLYDHDARGRFASLKSLNRISRDDLASFHHVFFQPQNIMFAVSGDISQEKSLALIKKFFGNWKPNGSSPHFPDAPEKSGEGIFIVHKDIPQSTVISGLLTVSKKDSDFYAFTVLDFIVGSGGFPSKIQRMIRNDEGLAYSAGSFYQAHPSHGVFGIYALTKTASTVRALTLMNSVKNNIHQSVTENELSWAKKSIDHGFIFSFTTPEDIVWQQMNADYEDLPGDFLMHFRDHIKEVTLEDVKKTARKYLNRNNTILILGDSKGFEKDLPSQPHQWITPED